ncbi:cephalosporin hydroxylase family protein [Rubrimonas cliftonensis]|uniref:Cephalosporin hydroxylase n=1 Tax=Rubrimonas cliftonensis TaxID=89524 RepID=A0A1H4G6S6_9RHOB|nr:CmcI family methyltransferase [Rubrimonas cliftonensis]SEB05343.1 Cephalosporin hydroxylase [Rubrimonas cliftonensis]
MKLTIDDDAATLHVTDADGERTLPLYCDEAFALISRHYVRVGWNQKYSYTFSWLGRPVIQLPDDMMRLQEAIFMTRPELIIETGVAHGGSLIFYASLFEAMGAGRVLGVDIEIRPHNRAAIEAHPMSRRIELVEGSSTAPEVIAQARAAAAKAQRVMVILDSDHSHAHVTAELEAYADLVTPGCHLVATDGVMREVAGTPRGKPCWLTDNPANAAEDFARRRADFVLERPAPPWSEAAAVPEITHFPSAWLRRL